MPVPTFFFVGGAAGKKMELSDLLCLHDTLAFALQNEAWENVLFFRVHQVLPFLSRVLDRKKWQGMEGLTSGRTQLELASAKTPLPVLAVDPRGKDNWPTAWIVDGNHRLVAFASCGKSWIPMQTVEYDLAHVEDLDRTDIVNNWSKTKPGCARVRKRTPLFYPVPYAKGQFRVTTKSAKRFVARHPSQAELRGMGFFTRRWKDFVEMHPLELEALTLVDPKTTQAFHRMYSVLWQNIPEDERKGYVSSRVQTCLECGKGEAMLRCRFCKRGFYCDAWCQLDNWTNGGHAFDCYRSYQKHSSHTGSYLSTPPTSMIKPSSVFLRVNSALPEQETHTAQRVHTVSASSAETDGQI